MAWQFSQRTCMGSQPHKHCQRQGCGLSLVLNLRCLGALLLGQALQQPWLASFRRL